MQNFTTASLKGHRDIEEQILRLQNYITALNKQPYMVKGDGRKVTITAGEGHFSGIDLGIGKYHFEVGAGKENFDWA